MQTSRFHALVLQVYVIGEEGILEELELAGFTPLGGPVSPVNSAVVTIRSSLS